MSDTVASPPPIKLRWFFGIFAAFLIFVVIAAFSSRIAKDAPTYDAEQGVMRMATLKKLQAEDRKTLTTADWIDQGKGVVRIPIDEAIPEEVATLKAKPVRMGQPIPALTPATTTPPPSTLHTLPAAAQNEAPAGAPNAEPGTNAAPTAPPAPAAPNK